MTILKSTLLDIKQSHKKNNFASGILSSPTYQQMNSCFYLQPLEVFARVFRWLKTHSLLKLALQTYWYGCSQLLLFFVIEIRKKMIFRSVGKKSLQSDDLSDVKTPNQITISPLHLVLSNICLTIWPYGLSAIVKPNPSPPFCTIICIIIGPDSIPRLPDLEKTAMKIRNSFFLILTNRIRQ